MRFHRGVLALLPALLPFAAHAQAPIPDAPTCARCRVTMTEVVRLEDSPTAHMPGAPRDVAVDGLGRYWLVYNGTLPLIYDLEGRLLRELGPRGDGPNEFRSAPLVIALPGDSVLVWDPGRSTFRVLSSDLVVRRSIAAPGRISHHVVLEWPDMLFNQTGGYVEAPGGVPTFTKTPFEVFSLSQPRARTLQSFGAGNSGGVATAGPLAAWVWDYSPYYIERWTAGGVRTAVIERRPDWFPWTDNPNPTSLPNQLPPPHLQRVQQDGAGRVWVFVNVPVEVWKEGEARRPSSQIERYYRTRIEVIDPAARRVIASTQMDAWIVATLPGLRAAVYGTTPQGTPFVRIVQLVMVQ